jgi:hypothetical protein
VSHLLCIPLPGVALVLKDEDNSRRLIIRDSIFVFPRAKSPANEVLVRNSPASFFFLGWLIPQTRTLSFPPNAGSTDCG